MKCAKFEECGREVYYEPTGLCLMHEKERRKRSAAGVQAAETRAANERKAARKRAATRKTTEAVTTTTEPVTETRA